MILSFSGHHFRIGFSDSFFMFFSHTPPEVIHANTQTNELIYTPSYFYIGHFSKFIRPKSKRISTSVSRSTIESTSFQNPDGKIVTVVMNKTNQNIDYKLIVGEYEARLSILPHSIQSLIY